MQEEDEGEEEKEGVEDENEEIPWSIGCRHWSGARRLLGCPSLAMFQSKGKGFPSPPCAGGNTNKNLICNIRQTFLAAAKRLYALSVGPYVCNHFAFPSFSLY